MESQGGRTTKPRVAVIGTGGTISFVGRHRLDLFEYGDYGRLLQVDELVASVAELAAEAEIVPVRFRAMPSYAVTPKDWLELNELVHRLAAEHAPLDGMVVTHGTASLEETAYFLNLTVKVDMPIVVVGAQRPPSALSSDAALNLLNAVRVAGCREARGLGVLTLLNDEIQAAREVSKTSTYRLEAFRTPDLGMLGYADADGRVLIYRKPTRRHAPDTRFDPRGVSTLPRVDIVYAYAGADRVPIDAVVAAGAKGIVVATMAPGRPTPAQEAGLDDARRRGVQVILSSRVLSGRVLDATVYRQRGYVAADNLNPQKARVLAMLGLTATDDPVELQRLFLEY